MTYSIINFYKFITLQDLPAWRERLLTAAGDRDLKGSIYLAEEGINAGLAGSDDAIEAFMAYVRGFPAFADLSFKKSYGDTPPYRRLLVKIKAQILTFPEPHQPDIAAITAGPRLLPADWDKVLTSGDKEVVIVDTRNDYEVAYGSFAGAEPVGIHNFRDFPEAFLKKYGEDKDKTYLMFCTGGIRCEKAVAFANKAGFPKVFQLEGGIINYFKENGRGHWQGSCFVFDDRWSIDTSLGETDATDVEQDA